MLTDQSVVVAVKKVEKRSNVVNHVLEISWPRVVLQQERAYISAIVVEVLVGNESSAIIREIINGMEPLV